MLYELISDQDYAQLPEEPELRFVAFESICRANLKKFVIQDTTASSDRFVRMQYMTTVAGAAEALEIEDIKYPNWLDDPADGTDDFMLSVSRAVTKIRLRNNSASLQLSVRLGAKTRGLIEQQINKLRDIISDGDIPEPKRKALLSRLDELSVELSQARVSFAKVMTVLAHVSMGVVTGTTFLAEAPHAIATISSLLGSDKAAEEAEANRLGPPSKPKALPSPTKPKASPDSIKATQALSRFGRSNGANIDDDIPF